MVYTIVGGTVSIFECGVEQGKKKVCKGVDRKKSRDIKKDRGIREREKIQEL